MHKNIKLIPIKKLDNLQPSLQDKYKLDYSMKDCEITNTLYMMVSDICKDLETKIHIISNIRDIKYYPITSSEINDDVIKIFKILNGLNRSVLYLRDLIK